MPDTKHLDCSQHVTAEYRKLDLGEHVGYNGLSNAKSTSGWQVWANPGHSISFSSDWFRRQHQTQIQPMRCEWKSTGPSGKVFSFLRGRNRERWAHPSSSVCCVWMWQLLGCDSYSHHVTQGAQACDEAASEGGRVGRWKESASLTWWGYYTMHEGSHPTTCTSGLGFIK